MKYLFLLPLVFTAVVFAAPEDPRLLWPDGAPGVAADAPEETVKEHWTEAHHNRHISRVSKPTVQLFKAPAENNTGASVVICPGGGYHILAWDHEGVQVAVWLNSVGVNAVLLKYRVPSKKGELVGFAPLQDAQRAIRYTRIHAEEWGIDPQRVGILGFSAGGNLTALASTQYKVKAYEPVDDIDQLSARPDFSVLVYPAYCYDKEKKALMANVPVDADTPPAFLVHAQNDPIDPLSSLYYYMALTEHKVPGELHVYPQGGHGYGMWDKGFNVNTWPARCAAWLREMGIAPQGGRP